MTGHQRVAIGMSPDEVHEFLGRGRIMTVASHNADGWVHLVPMWYALAEGQAVMWTNGRSQKIVNLRRDPRLTALVETGERYEELAGVQLIGRAELIEDPAAVLAIGRTVAERYTLPATEEILRYQATKRVAIRIVAERVVSWDHGKLLPPG
jgi:PPOX class probable F420-dependent enzyme